MGFLHTGATFTADLNLVIQLLMGAALLFGMRLARQRRFRAHARCQATVMVLNLVMIALIMVPSFRLQVAPRIRKTTSDLYYTFPAIHAALGTIAELLGLYVVLVALGVKIVPRGLRFRNYRAWMRTTLVLWWLVIGLGVGTYVVWYMAETTTSAPPTQAAAVPTTTAPAPATAAVTSPPVAISLKNFEFTPPEITVPVGTTVTWTDTGGRHTVWTEDGYLKSDTLLTGNTYQKTFDKPGVYEYFCDFHGGKGTGMSGKITVVAK